MCSAQLSQAHHLREKNVEEKPNWVVDTVRGPELIVFVEENKEEEKKRISFCFFPFEQPGCVAIMHFKRY